MLVGFDSLEEFVIVQYCTSTSTVAAPTSTHNLFGWVWISEAPHLRELTIFFESGEPKTVNQISMAFWTGYEYVLYLYCTSTRKMDCTRTSTALYEQRGYSTVRATGRSVILVRVQYSYSRPRRRRPPLMLEAPLPHRGFHHSAAGIVKYP